MATKDHAQLTPTTRPTWNLGQHPDAPPLIALAERLEGYIEQRACGRIRDLHVLCNGSLITLEGRSQTYHAKQLAQEAVLDLTEGQIALVNHIVVS